MRIAWLGPEPSLTSGVPYAAAQILHGLVEQGVEVDAYINPIGASYADRFPTRHGLRVFEGAPNWQWHRWYSRDPLLAATTSLAARVLAQRRLMDVLAKEHARRPYDLIYQFSQFEVPWLRGKKHAFPPVIVHPEVHMAGELRWHRREHALAVRCGGKTRTGATTTLLAFRTLIQRRDAQRVAAIIAPSRAFAQHIADDYKVAVDRIHVVPNPIDLERYVPDPLAREECNDPLELLYVSRLSVRKGLETIVEISHRLARRGDGFRIRIVGGHSLFSDYRPLLEGLHPTVGLYEGQLTTDEVVARYRSADMVLQPSHYEPFALTVAEALASGCPVITSDAVGATEDVARGCARRFVVRDIDGFEAAVRDLAAVVRDPAARRDSRALARSEAERLFAPEHVCKRIIQVFSRVLAASR